MEGIQRFNLYVSTATVAVMFGIIEYVMPMLQASGIPPALLQLIPFAAPVQIVEASKLVIAALATLGTYRLLAKILIPSIDHLPFIKPLIFGPSYVEGTWIGRFGAPTQLKWTVEHFEQDFAGIRYSRTRTKQEWDALCVLDLQRRVSRSASWNAYVHVQL